MSAEDIAAAALAGLNTPKPSVSDRNRVSNIVKDAVVRAENESSKNPQEGARNSTAKGSSDASKQTTTKKTKATKSSSPELASVTSTVSTNDKKKGKRNKEEVKFPVEPRVIQVIKKPRTYMNHSYRDFSCVPPELGDECPSEISEMTFPQKVHHMLSQEEYSKMIAWQAHGRAFRIIIPKMFETKVCPSYLQHSRYSSFLRQLSNYGFKHITQGRDRNCYYHEVRNWFASSE